MRRLLCLCAVFLLLPSLSRACLQDRDSLETEARGVPDVMRALSGRFERNPPLFYEVRIHRVERELQAAPHRLDLYDNIAVAHDRLGRDDEALRWIEKKRARLQVLDARQPDVREHWYRFWANAGTFRAHRWIHNGADRKNLSEVRQARDEIARAIAIKPDAHFGREKYQLKAMQWILKPPRWNQYEPLPDLLELNGEHSKYSMGDKEGNLALLQKRGLEDAERGLTGLVTLGAAWQSVDVFNTLLWVSKYRRDSSVSHLLAHRVQELAAQGRGSLHPQAPSGQQLSNEFEPRVIVFDSPQRPNGQELAAIYKRLRAEADDWHARRTAFMLARLESSRHPDTDPAFWNGWDDGTPPSLEPPTRWSDVLAAARRWGMSVCLVLLSGVFGALVVRDRRAKLARHTAHTL